MFKRMLLSFGLLIFIAPLHAMAPITHVSYEEGQNAIVAWIRIDGLVKLAHVVQKDLRSNQYTYFQVGNDVQQSEIATDLKRKISEYEGSMKKQTQSAQKPE